MKVKLVKSIFITLALMLAVAALFLFKLQVKEPAEEVNPIPVRGNNELPEFFPDDFPILESAQIVSSSQTQSKTGTGMSVLLETESSVIEVAEYYKKELLIRGWEVEIVREDETAVTFIVSKDIYSGPLGITEGDGGTTLIFATIGI
jgi:uncharacterized secreted protein with C-terminal beta-propeller domain